MFNGKMKALTFSYDDGITTDGRLIDILNRYGMRGTFNLNSATHVERGNPRMERIAKDRKTQVARYWRDELADVYKGHEIAVHALTHPDLTKLSEEECCHEILADVENLTAYFGTKPVGMAYPYGTHNDAVVNVLRDCGIRYSRTTVSTRRFDIPCDLLRLPATCHHNDAALMELAEQFVNAEPETPMLFYVWGHSYEFADRDNWDVIERFCDYMAGRDDIFYGTNAEVLL
ncbi:MAG: polysaccharide deacetylase family protein [Clostridia bacterium]|nr:polysaccharide deacetylase family protein [Clostridia bacterium]